MKFKIVKITAIVIAFLFAGVVAWSANVLTKRKHEMWE